MRTTKRFATDIGGRTLSVEFSDLAGRADGTAYVRLGDTAVFVTAVLGAKKELEYFPLLVDYEERFYAAGMILGSRFIRREGRPSDEAILNARLVDRTIRPLFDKNLYREVQVVATALAIDEENDPDVLAILGASLALGSSQIPWNGPVAAARVGRVDGRFILNPTYAERKTADLDLVLSVKNGRVNMMEAGAKEVPEEAVLDAIAFALPELTALEAFLKEVIAEVGKEKMALETPSTPDALTRLFREHIAIPLEEALFTPDAQERRAALESVTDQWRELVSSTDETLLGKAETYLEEQLDALVHKNAIEKNRRQDGRAMTDIRALWAEAGLVPRAHGSGLFYRGDTHILSIVTLGAPADAQLIEGMEVRTKKHFMHHYNFPPYSVGETRPMRGPGRREIGHGALAERALEAVIPSKEDFPSTLRLVSETLSSNGSSSMGSVCASTLALMDAGVPIRRPVAGIAMGLVMHDDEHYRVLTDIQGPEDHYGDMDFKLAGTEKGATAIQMDVKVDGVPLHVLKDAFRDARDARMRILETLAVTLPAPRAALSPHAPRVVVLEINPDKIRDVVGPGGRVINDIIAQTETEIDIEQTGKVYITGRRNGNVDRAAEMIKTLTREYLVGEEFFGTVTRLFEFGAMVEIAPGQEGLIHVSKLIPGTRVREVADVLRAGDKVGVRIDQIDEQGRLNLVPTTALGARYAGEKTSTESDQPRSHYRTDNRNGNRGNRGPGRFQGGARR